MGWEVFLDFGGEVIWMGGEGVGCEKGVDR